MTFLSVPPLKGFAGQVLAPGDDGYEACRLVWNAIVDRRPALIARCTSPSDVAAAVRYGRRHGLEIGVRSGGHNIVGISVPDGGLMLDLSPMDDVRVDPERRLAWIGGGALLGVLDRATQRYDLATTAGNVSHTGVGGLTLGGGMGWLARRFGLTCDSVTGIELVSADGELLRASQTENPDLFWGLRGGGGNFGVATTFEFRLHEVGTAALLADLFYRPEEAPAAMRVWRDLLPEAPRQATFTAWVGTTAQWPFLPPELHGQWLVSVGYVWVGDPDSGQDLLAAVRDAVPPRAERSQALSYLELQTMDDSLEGHRWRRYWKGHYLRALDDAAIDAFISRGVRAGDPVDLSTLPRASLQAYGGAISDVGDDETAFGHRETLVEFVAAAQWADPAEDEARIAAARRFGAAIEPFASGAYVNSLSDEGAEGVRRAYGAEKLARLVALKRRYDPDNVFHLNHNIAP
jgi:FAD/FMN-containing dehydrogenase